MKKIVLILIVFFLFYPSFFQEEPYNLEEVISEVEEFLNEKITEESIINNPEEIESVPETLILEKNIEVVEEVDNKDLILLKLPFIAQAPLGNWQDPRQQDACEEAGVIMAMAWVRGIEQIEPLVAQSQIIELADWEQAKYGEHRDLHISDVAQRLFIDYFDYNQVEIKEIKNKEDLIDILEKGNLILAPSDGRALKNPNFTPPGPDRHLLVIIGYDFKTDEFITNDPGTRQGQSFRYPSARLLGAIRPYPSGYHEPIIDSEPLILVVSK